MQLAPPFEQNNMGRVEKNYVLLINPFYPKDPISSFGKHVLTPSLALTSLAGSTPQNWRVEYWDENLLQGSPPSNPLPEVVGITVHLTFSKRAYELARWYRERGVLVILGGLHVSACPDEVRPHCDILVKGEGVKIWPTILNDISKKDYKPYYESKFDKTFSAEAPPNRSILNKRAYLTPMSAIATRGCHNRCGFCFLATRGLKMPYSTKGVQQIVEQIREGKSKYVVFTDNNLGSDIQYLQELCHALKPLNIIWSSAVSLDVSDHPEILYEMALSGCNGVFIGFESLADENIQNSNKKSPLTADYSRRVQLFHSYGISVNASFVFGFDHDTTEVFQTTIDWVEENRIASATFHILTPYPGTPLFRQMETDGRILHRNWEHYDTAHVVFEPTKMSTKELKDGYDEVYKKLFSLPSIWKRRPQGLTTSIAYLAGAILYKKSNFFWHILIRMNLSYWVWIPMVELARRRHLIFRKDLEKKVNSEYGKSSILLPGV